MGTLIAFRYPTNLFARLADHTYVACGTLGKAWSCWGGKTGGTELRRAPGSTLRADRIAEPDERAGITCYLINGVCHQAANRILLPAGITVLGARGYSVSEALFGTYGRPRGFLGLCRAPFHRHAGVTGDLPACLEAAGPDAPASSRQAAEDPRRQAYLAQVLHVYESADTDRLEAWGEGDVIRFQLELFAAFLAYKLPGAAEHGPLLRLREEVERTRLELEARFSENRDAAKFGQDFDDLTVYFQRSAEGLVESSQYSALFDLEPGEYVTLADPAIMERAYGPGGSASA